MTLIIFILIGVIMYIYIHYTTKVHELQQIINKKEFEIERHLANIQKLMKPIKSEIKKEFRKLTN